jgi:hypothetical protein
LKASAGLFVEAKPVGVAKTFHVLKWPVSHCA